MLYAFCKMGRLSSCSCLSPLLSLSFQAAVEVVPVEGFFFLKENTAWQMISELNLSLIFWGKGKCFRSAAVMILNWFAFVSFLALKESLCFTRSSLTAALLKYSYFKCTHFHKSLYYFSPCKTSFNPFLVSTLPDSWSSAGYLSVFLDC